jgi:hypothetical protein
MNCSCVAETWVRDSRHGLAKCPNFIVRGMLQCDSKVCFPDDPAQAQQFSDFASSQNCTAHNPFHRKALREMCGSVG